VFIKDFKAVKLGLAMNGLNSLSKDKESAYDTNWEVYKKIKLLKMHKENYESHLKFYKQKFVPMYGFHYNNRGLFCDPHIIANNKERSFRKPAFANHNSSQTVKPLRYYNICTRTIASPSQLPNLIQSQTFYDCNCFYIPFTIDITSKTICNKPIVATTWRIDSKVYRFPK